MHVRTEAVFLSAIVAGAWLASSILGLRAPASARATAIVSSVPTRADADRALAQADTARKHGDLAGADRLYRIAWTNPADRARAADALRSLENAGYDRPVDEEKVSQTTALLGSSFRRSETDHFVLLSDAPRSATIAKLGALERARRQFFRVMDRLGAPARPAVNKLLCVLFADHAMYRAFASAQDNVDAGWVAGYYASLSNRAVFYEDATGPNFTAASDQLDQAQVRVKQMRSKASAARRDGGKDQARLIAAQADQLSRNIRSERLLLNKKAKQSSISKTIHESIHLLAFNTGVQSRSRRYPFWLTEGMATSFETDRTNAAFGPDRPGSDRQGELFDAIDNDRTIPLSQLVSLSAPPSDDPFSAQAVYAQAWSLFTYLYRTDRRALAQFFEDMLAEPPGQSSSERRLEMFEKRFGDVDRLERRWLRQVRR